jgi:diacylglycerol kinase (ATP)
MSKILFVVNPVSGDKDKEPLLSKIEFWVKSLNHEHKTWKTTGENDKEKLKKELDSYQPDKVVAVGGDGTLMLCAELLKNSSIPLGLIPGGSANGMASELGIPESEEDALGLLEHGHLVKADMLSFNGGQQLGIHISDIGLNAQLVKNFEESERRGFLGYAQGLISELSNSEPFHARLILDGEEIERDCLMIAFANAKRYGTGALLTKDGKVDDGAFEIYLLKELNLKGIVGQILNILPEDSDYFEIHQVKKAEIVLKEPQEFQVDGELMDKTQELSVEIEAACLNLIAGEMD